MGDLRQVDYVFDAFKSSPASMLAKIVWLPGDAGPSGDAHNQVTFPDLAGKKGSLTVSFDVRIDAFDHARGSGIAVVGMSFAPGDLWLATTVTWTGSAFESGVYDGVNQNLIGNWDWQSWTNIRWEIDIGDPVGADASPDAGGDAGTGNVRRIYFDNQLLGTCDIRGAVARGAPTVDLGVLTNEQRGPWTMRCDNFVAYVTHD